MADAGAPQADTAPRTFLQGVVRSFDPTTNDGTLVCDTDLAEYELARDALGESVFRMLRQGQRVVFDVDASGMATRVRTGSERDMGTPGFPPRHPDDVVHPQGGELG